MLDVSIIDNEYGLLKVVKDKFELLLVLQDLFDEEENLRILRGKHLVDEVNRGNYNCSWKKHALCSLTVKIVSEELVLDSEFFENLVQVVRLGVSRNIERDKSY